MPIYGLPEDVEARRVFESLFPGSTRPMRANASSTWMTAETASIGAEG